MFIGQKTQFLGIFKHRSLPVSTGHCVGHCERMWHLWCNNFSDLFISSQCLQICVVKHLEVIAETLLNKEFCSLKWHWQHLFPSGMQLLYCPRIPFNVFKVIVSDNNQGKDVIPVWGGGVCWWGHLWGMDRAHGGGRAEGLWNYPFVASNFGQVLVDPLAQIPPVQLLFNETKTIFRCHGVGTWEIPFFCPETRVSG